MSFLIRDILKKDENCAPKEVGKSERRIVRQDSYENNSSILQQTLLNKINPYYTQNSGDFYASNGFYSFLYNNNNSEMYKYSANCADYNIQKGKCDLHY